MEGLSPTMSPLRVSKFLRQSLPPELSRLGSALHQLRIRSRRRFKRIVLPFLNSKALEQASSENVAMARAARILALQPGGEVYDATCGIGADSCALAISGAQVISGDLDHENILFARANFQANGVPNRVVRAEASSLAVRSQLILLDPDRRGGGQRSLDPASWSPSLGRSLSAATHHAGACIKLAPALSPEVLIEAESVHLPAELPRRREWLSHHGELAEVCLWIGSLAGDDPPDRQATYLDRSGEITYFTGSPVEVEALRPEEAAEVAWIADPDPALLRSGLLGNLARELGLAPLASQIAYLGGQEDPVSPFLRSWRVLDSSSLDARRVRAMLAKHDVGPIRVRKRGHPDRPEALERRFKGRGSRSGELLVVRLERGHRAFLVEAAPRAPQAGLVGDEGFEPPTSSL